jgi:hypothetical protein
MNINLFKNLHTSAQIKAYRAKSMMIIRYIHLALATVLLSVVVSPYSAWAGTSQLGHITSIGSSGGGVHWFTISSGHQNAPACQGSYVADRWAINTNSSGGQALWSTILTAYSLRKQVTVTGAAVCTDLGDTESVGYIDVVG